MTTIEGQNVSGSQTKTLFLPSRKVSQNPRSTLPFFLLGFQIFAFFFDFSTPNVCKAQKKELRAAKKG